MSAGVLLRLLLVAAAGVSCSQLIRGKSPALALAVSLAAVLSLLGLALPGLRTLWQSAGGLLAQSGLERELFLPVVKVLAITQVTHISAELCRDAGESALGSLTESAGAVCALAASLPLLRTVMDILWELL